MGREPVRDPAVLLEAGLRRLGLAVPAAPLLAYMELLARWNRAYNLTAVREPARMVSHHLLDSLAVLPWVRGPRVADAGTGAGLPGIPLAVARPDWAFTLIDAGGKKTRFVTQAVAELGLANVTVVHSRVEDFRPEAPFDTVVSRAFAALDGMLAATAHLGGPGTRWLAMKGRPPEAELAAVPAPFRVEAVEPVQVPGLDAARSVVIISRAQGDESTS